MNIGILTFHRPINYGAFLQSFSLSSRLAKEPNFNVEIIDYIAPKEKLKIPINALWTLKHYGFSEFFHECAKIKAFANSVRNLRTSQKSFCTSKLENLYKYIDERYDVLVIGSDAVFNWNQTGFPTAFIPSYHFKKCKVYSYAASVHGLRYKEVSQPIINECHKALSRFEMVGARDLETEKFTKYCCPEAKVLHCCDPTIFIDLNAVFSKANGYEERIQRKYGFSVDSEFVVVMLPDNQLNKQICEEFQDRYKIISLFKPASRADYFLYDLSPFEWVAVLSKAKAVITSYFHGSLLSMKVGTPVLCVDYSKYDGEYEGKMYDLFIRRIHLPELYNTYQTPFDTIKDKINKILKTDYQQKIEDAFNAEEEYINKFITSLNNCK